MSATCPLCHPTAAENQAILWEDALCRVIRVDDALYPGFCRLIWKDHVAELTDLSPDQRSHCLKVLCGVETALRQLMHPDKINLASLGNMVPHLHWHIIPRRRSDPHFPNSIWGPQTQTETQPPRAPEDAALAAAIRQALAA